MSHTPIPWRITEASEKKTREIFGSNGATVAKLTALDIDNAELIVRAVNSHDDLVEALENILYNDLIGVVSDEEINSTWESLKKAKGE